MNAETTVCFRVAMSQAVEMCKIIVEATDWERYCLMDEVEGEDAFLLFEYSSPRKKQAVIDEAPPAMQALIVTEGDLATALNLVNPRRVTQRATWWLARDPDTGKAIIKTTARDGEESPLVLKR